MYHMPLFDTHVVVDWSARSRPSPPKPHKDSIWWADADTETGMARTPEYARTRYEAVERLAILVAGKLDEGRRVLVGFDFPFGYPAGVAERLTGRASGLELWGWLTHRIEDAKDNANNRYEVAAKINRKYPGTGPFWGRPRQWNSLTDIPIRARERTRRERHPPERRIADLRARGAKTVWQLAYTGSVGSQVLLGLPAIERLIADRRIEGRSEVWPFQTGLRAPPYTPCLCRNLPLPSQEEDPCPQGTGRDSRPRPSPRVRRSLRPARRAGRAGAAVQRRAGPLRR